MYSQFLIVLLALASCIDQRLPYFLASGHEEDGSVKELFEGCTQSECEALSFHPNLEVAIYAKWMAIRSDKKFRKSSDDRQLLESEFRGFVSGRLMMPLPKWWRDFPDELDFEEITLDHGFVQTNGIRHAEKYKLDEIDPNKIVIKTDQLSIELDGDSNGWLKKGEPAEFFHKSQGADCVAVDIKDNRIFVAVLPVDCNDGFKVFCADLSGAYLWSGYVSKYRQVELTSHHSGRGMIEIRSNQNLVAVFWRNGWEGTIDVFDVSTGQQVLDFTTLVEFDD